PVATARSELTPSTASPSPAIAIAPVSSAELDNLRAENEQLQKQLADVTSQHSAASKTASEQASALSTQLDGVRAELAQAQEAVAALQVREKDALARLEQAEQQAGESQRSASDLQDRLTRAITADQLTAIEEKLQAAEQQAESLRGEVAVANKRAEEVMAKYGQAEKLVGEQKEALERAEKKLAETVEAASSLAMAAEKAAEAFTE
ncbi:hypothetical protein FBU59_004371, partial [Linderina macrospora]